jgi:hypothetical protein
MKSRNLLFGGLIAATMLAGTAGIADAYRGDHAVKGPLYSAERHAAMTAAFRNNDYDAWKKLMEDRGRTRVTQIINKDNFPRFAEAHRLALEGKPDDAKKIRAELGLGLRNGTGMGQGMGQHRWQK